MTDSFDGVKLIKAVNDREIGHTCFREVEICIGSINKSISNPTRRINIKSLRISNGNMSKTFFCAISPFYFKNISFLMIEKKGCTNPFEILLYIPYGLKLIRNVDEKRRFQEILGSDFTYDDLKTWLYIENQKYYCLKSHSGNEVVIGNNPQKMTNLIYRNWEKQILRIDKEKKILLECSFFKQIEDNKPFKNLKYEGYKEIDGIQIQQNMKMINFKLKNETNILLKSCWHNQTIDEAMFEGRSFKKLINNIDSFN